MILSGADEYGKVYINDHSPVRNPHLLCGFTLNTITQFIRMGNFPDTSVYCLLFFDNFAEDTLDLGK